MGIRLKSDDSILSRRIPKEISLFFDNDELNWHCYYICVIEINFRNGIRILLG